MERLVTDFSTRTLVGKAARLSAGSPRACRAPESLRRIITSRIG